MGRSSKYTTENPTYSSGAVYSDEPNKSSTCKTRYKVCAVLIILTILIVAAVLIWYFVSRDDKDKDDSKEAVDTISYSLAGDVTIDDVTRWPYTTSLSQQSNDYTIYQRRFCDEIKSSQHIASLHDVACSVERFTSGSLVVSFSLSVEEVKADNITENNIDAHTARSRLQSVLSITEVFLDNEGEIQNVPGESINIDGYNIGAAHGIAVINLQYFPELEDSQSQQYQDLEDQFCSEILDGVREGNSMSDSCHVNAMAAGSVQVFYSVTRLSETTIDNENLVSRTEAVIDNTDEFEVTSSTVYESIEELCDTLGCDHICSIQTVPRCECRDGYRLQINQTCQEIDECAEDSDTCEEMCHNTIGSFECSCPTGYVLNVDGVSCSDADECRTGQHNCPQDCENTVGSFVCSCFTGYQDQNGACVDIDECLINNGGCPTQCYNTPGSFTCVICTAGMFTCHSTGECVPMSDKCDGLINCDDFSDEVDCACDDPSTQKQCDLGPCIDALSWCDGTEDCIDGSDEIRECPAECPPSTFKCDIDFVKFKCVPRSYICDGEADCLGATDELDCVCAVDTEQCQWGGLCIKDTDKCDGHNNCFDFSDEIGCHRDSCPSHTVRCDASSVRGNADEFYCLHKAFICDNIRDCPLGEDETPEMCQTFGPGTGILADCITSLDATTTIGYFTSLNYPSDYDHNQECYWVITAPDGYIIELTFITFTLENAILHVGCSDAVLVYDGRFESLLWQECGTQNNAVVRSSSNILGIVFATDHSVAARGFRASFKATPTTPCVGLYQASDRSTIQSPGFPNSYPEHLGCQWYILADAGEQVSLQITEFDLNDPGDNCETEFIAVFDSVFTEVNDEAIETVKLFGCGNSPATTEFTSTGGVLSVIMVTNGRTTSDKGFHAIYSQVGDGGNRPSTCGGEISVSSSERTISTPAYPSNYGDEQKCVWRFEAPSGYRVKLVFSELNLEQCGADCCDSVQVIENSEVLYEGCGLGVSGLSVVSTGQYLTVKFTSDTFATFSGFQATYSRTVTGVSEFPDRPIWNEVAPTMSPMQQECYNNEGYLCTSGNCIQYHKRCDGISDCADGSDEQDCACEVGKEIQCADTKKCYAAARRCDWTNDCADHSDEWHCGDCPREKWLCETQQRCMPRDWWCDGEVDCEGGADEAQCGSCSANEYQCSTHECISQAQRCDGQSQCEENSDEHGCAHLLSATQNPDIGILAAGADANYGVCDVNWNMEWAHVACRQMGFHEATTYESVTVSDVSIDNLAGYVTVSNELSKSNLLSGATFGDTSSCTNVIRLTCARIQCGRPIRDPEQDWNQAKVVNSDIADRAAWPWMISMHHRSNAGNHICGGSVLNSRWIITAAHCLSGAPSDYTIHIGSQHRDLGTVYNVERVIKHPNYTATGRGEAAVSFQQNKNDIALIKVSTAITFNENSVMPVCVPHEGLTESHFRRCYVTGWGQVLPEHGLGAAPHRLRQGKLNLMSIPDCQAYYTDRWDEFRFHVPYSAPVYDTHVCAGQVDSHIDACYGDSGGPLSCEDHNGNWYVFGLVSAGPIQDCLRFSIYERVNSHLEWMQSIFQQYGDGL